MRPMVSACVDVRQGHAGCNIAVCLSLGALRVISGHSLSVTLLGPLSAYLSLVKAQPIMATKTLVGLPATGSG